MHTEIEVMRPIEDARWHLLDDEVWKQWWGGNLKEARSGWENGAEMVQEMGCPSTVSSLTECESLGIQDEWMLSTIGLAGRGADRRRDGCPAVRRILAERMDSRD